MNAYQKPNGFGNNKGNRGFDRRDSGRPSFGGKPGFKGGRDGERSEMFTATCDECHKQCEVPFRPNGSKPVYCNDCFSAKRGGSSDYPKRDHSPHDYPKRDFAAPSSPRPQVEDKRIDELKKQMDAMNSKLDRVLQMMNPTPAVSQDIEIKAEPAPVKLAVKKTASEPKKADKKVVAKKKTTTKKK